MYKRQPIYCIQCGLCVDACPFDAISRDLKTGAIRVDADKCTGCGTCVDVCPVGVYELRDDKSVPVNVDECILCRACETQCPNNAIEIIE